MTRTLKLETISFKQRRAKFEGNLWLTLSPFINLDDLKFGSSYTIDLVLDKSNQWYIETMTPADKVKN